MEPINIPPSISCPLCNGFNVIEQLKLSYFTGEKPSCPHCKKEFDWWDAILLAVKDRFFLFQMLAPIGAEATVFKVVLSPNESTKINFTEYGVPSDARILDILYTPETGGLFPLEMHGNHPLRHITGNQIVLYPMPMKGQDEYNDTNVNILATWVSHTPDDDSWQNLVSSFEAYSQQRYNACIIPANVAVESKLSRLLSEYLKSFASKDSIEDFLETGATYSHQLNVVLPLIATKEEIPLLPDNIRGLLNRLRRLRNDMVHYGKTDKLLEKDEAAELIISALFGFYYITLVERNSIKT